jgi:hypothetical protein
MRDTAKKIVCVRTSVLVNLVTATFRFNFFCFFLKSTRNDNGIEEEEQAFSAFNLNVNAEIVDSLSTSCFTAKIAQNSMLVITETRLEEIIALFTERQALSSKTVLN